MIEVENMTGNQLRDAAAMDVICSSGGSKSAAMTYMITQITASTIREAKKRGVDLTDLQRKTVATAVLCAVRTWDAILAITKERGLELE